MENPGHFSVEINIDTVVLSVDTVVVSEDSAVACTEMVERAEPGE